MTGKNTSNVQSPETASDTNRLEQAREATIQQVQGGVVARIWDLFPTVSMQVRQKHEEVGLHGHHDWVHAFRVGEVARQVAAEEWNDERTSHLAGLSGLSHNADRLIQKERNVGRRDVPREAVGALVTTWVQDVLDKVEQEMVVDAVLSHDGKNSANDSKVLVALMDGDRVVNLDTDLFPRSGQYYHDLPVVDYKHFLGNPEATYRNPGSVLRDIAYSLDWADPTSAVCVRTQRGQKMAKDRVTVFQTFFDALKRQLAEEGMHPFTL